LVTFFTSPAHPCRGIIHYRDDDLSELPDAEICNELEPQGIINVKRFISRKTGQEVKIKHLLGPYIDIPIIFFLIMIRLMVYMNKVKLAEALCECIVE
jgi:hypothetical protein